MNSSFFIARRYLFSKKSHNVINIISAVSVFGIMISTAALVIVLSAFNGIENLVINLFSTFEQDIKIESANTKSFAKNYVPDEVYNVEGLINYTNVIEEIVILKNDDQFIIGTAKGVDPAYLEMSHMKENLLDGVAELDVNGSPVGLVGNGVLMNLGGYIYESDIMSEIFTIYCPNRNEKISRRNVDAFTTAKIPIAGTFSFNKDVDESYIVLPIDYAAEIMDFQNEITSIEMNFEEGVDLESKKEELKEILGPSFKVKTINEQNEIYYQTAKSEKWMTTMLLSFIMFLATFNMVASITMLVIEKRDNLQTLYSIGARKVQLHNIFFYVGLLINILGLLFGLLIGYGICLLQQKVGLIRMEGSVVEFFPVNFKLTDLFLILGITGFIGVITAYLPSKFLIKRIIK
ncbi:MAG: FtsX-like permease family protein [Crocinitomicaceae bacterium]